MDVVTHNFAPRDIVSGHLALDLVNTVTARDMPTPKDWLDGYQRLLDWAALAGGFEADTLAGLRLMALRSPGDADDALERLRRLRESLHRLFSALIAGAVAREPLAGLEANWKAGTDHARLAQAGDRIDRVLTVEDSGLDLIADTVALAAVDLLRDFPKARARVCRGGQCGWLFIDSSKAGRRVWCDMATCGNAAKSRRHQARRRGSS